MTPDELALAEEMLVVQQRQAEALEAIAYGIRTSNLLYALGEDGPHLHSEPDLISDFYKPMWQELIERMMPNSVDLTKAPQRDGTDREEHKHGI